MDCSLLFETLLYLGALFSVFWRTTTDIRMMMKMRTAMLTIMETDTAIAMVSDGEEYIRLIMILNVLCIIRIHIINCCE